MPEALSFCMQHFLYFLPLPQGQGSLGPTLVAAVRTGCFFITESPLVPVSLATFSRLISWAGRTWARKMRRRVSSRMEVKRQKVAKEISTNAPDKSVKKQPVRTAATKVGPNDPCPCGSGKKYKKCCMHKDKTAE